MATTIIGDDTLWVRHIEGDPTLARRIRALGANDPIVLRVAGCPIRFRKMHDAPDGRPTDGIRPDPDFLAVWRGLQARRGTPVTVEPDGGPDPYLLSSAATLTEWNSPEDAAAYDDL